jgi:anti-sigma-K factor RskA
MSDASSAVKNLRERLTGAGEDHLGKALGELLDNPLLTGTIGRAFDAREKAAQAQELAMGALNIPSAADIERLTRRLRSVSQRLEGIEDGVHRLDRALSSHGVESRLSKIEEQLGTLARKLGQSTPPASGRSSGSSSKSTSAGKSSAAKRAAASKPRARRSAASGATAKPKKS